jgi:hypothetical protein
LKRNWIRRVAPTNQEATGPLSKKEDQRAVADITITPKDIPIGDHIAAQFHPLSKSIRGLGWMD